MAEKRGRGRPRKPKNPFTDSKFIEATGLGKKDMTDVTVYQGDNAQIMAHNLQLYSLSKIDTNDPEAVLKRTHLYFKKCAENDMKPSVAGYALALKVDRATLYKWVAGISHKNPAVVEILTDAYVLLNAQMEDYMLNNKANTVGLIFLMKNNLGYRDQTEYVVQNNAPEKTADELITAAKQLPDK